VSARKYSLDDILNLIVKHRWLILIPFAVGLAAAPLLAGLAPIHYRSEALILVVPQQVPKDLVRPTVLESVEERLPAITDQIMSRARLERIILDMNLYPDLRKREVMEDVVAAMRQDVHTIPSGKGLNSFRVTYTSDQPEVARQVTERLASLYIEQNIRERSQQAESTTAFLGTQLEDAKRRLLEQEKKVAEYQRAHAGQLPSQLQANMAGIQNAGMQLQQLNGQTNLAQERKLNIERNLADARAALAELPGLSGESSAGPGGPTTADELEAAKDSLSSASARLTPGHPEIKSLQRSVAELTAKLESERAAAQAAASGNSTDRAPIPPTVAARQKRVRDLENELASIDRQLAQARIEETKLKKALSDYQARVEVLPTREAELVNLTRDYATLQTNYSNLLLKREESNVATNLERKQIGENFQLLDSASHPGRPDNELQRLGVTASGAIGGLVLGLLIIALREYRDSSFRSKEEVVKAIALPVLASIPVMTSPREQQLAVRRRRMLDVGGSVLLVASVAIVVAWRLY
jgi:polysaccharide chain length determinant protein (PEP-CTERM system associated)